MADYYRLRILLEPVDAFGKRSTIGHHCLPSTLQDVANAIDDCTSKGFETLVLYTSVPSVDLFRPYFDQYWDTEETEGGLNIYL